MAEETVHDSNFSKREEPRASAPWERDLLEKVLMASIIEQRRSRRWGIFFKIMLMLYLGVTLLLVARPFDESRLIGHGTSHTAVIDVTGMITPGQPANADNIIEGLRAAAEDQGTKGIILRMNTPGGSPVQSAYVYDEIQRLKKVKPNLPIYAVIVDMCTSGGYYIAAATDKIFVNGASMIGSIGVIMDGFGFVDALDKLGIERRVLTAGEHKAIFDPFSPIDPIAEKQMQSVLNEVHQQFINAVKQGRGERLNETPDMFSGLVWTGAEGIKLGLVDAVGDVRYVAETVIGAKNLVNFTPEDHLLNRIAHRLGTSVGEKLWSRFRNEMVAP
jgi:protease-4